MGRLIWPFMVGENVGNLHFVVGDFVGCSGGICRWITLVNEIEGFQSQI